MESLRFNGACLITLFFSLNAGQSGCFADTTNAQSYPVTTFINAKWQQTPLYMEMAEYLADINAGTFWGFIDRITQDVGDAGVALNEHDTSQQQYNAALQAAYALVGPVQVPMMNLVVALHSLTPRIQTHFQLADELLAHDVCDGKIFAQVNGMLACDLAQLKQELAVHIETPEAAVELYGFDHVYPGSEHNAPTVILYGDIGSREFVEHHNYLSKQASEGRLRYVLRHYLQQRAARLVRLAGYGVELYLKSTEYKSQDDAPKPHDSQHTESPPTTVEEQTVAGFDFNVLKARQPKLASALENLRQSLLKTKYDLEQLKAWEFQDLGLQATAAVVEIGHNDEALQMLQFNTNNFPMQAHSLLGQKVSEALRNEVKHNMETLARTLNIQAPDGALFVNGLYFDADTIDLNTLVESLRSELRVLESLYSSDIHGALAAQLLTLNLAGNSKQDFAIDIRDTAIHWLNDLTKDAQYRHWPKSVTDLLRPSFPGMMRNVRQHLFNVVLVVDPLQPQVRSIIKIVEYFLMHSAPVRFGIVFDARQANESTAQDYLSISCAFNYVASKKTPRDALGLLSAIYKLAPEGSQVQHEHIVAALAKLTYLSAAEAERQLDEDGSYDFGRQLAKEFIERLGRAESDLAPVALLNGVPLDSSALLSERDFEETIVTEIMQLTSTLRQAVYQGDLTDEDEVLDYLMDQPHVMPRLNQRILSTEEANYLDISGKAFKDLENIAKLAQLTNRDMTATLMANLKFYFEAKHASEQIGKAKLHAQTLWICADIEQPEGRELLKNALLYMKSATSVRVAFLPNTEGKQLDVRRNLNSLVWSAMHTLPSTRATDVVIDWLSSNSEQRSVPAELDDIIDSAELHLKMLRVYAQRVLGIAKSQRLVVSNTRLIGPLAPNEQFTIEDFGLLDRFCAQQYGDKIRKILLNAAEDITSDFTSDKLLKLYASLLPRESKTRFKMPDDLRQKHSVLLLPPKSPNKPHFELTAIVDPASRAAQKLATILLLLRNTLNCQLRLVLTPVAGHSDLPVKNFYRYVVESELQFTATGALADGPQAKFTGLPRNSLLTQHLQVPENWLVEAVRSVYDLDNIKLADIGGPVHSEFELEYLLLEGHCFDANSGQPPRGLQLTLGTATQPVLVDTIVMANLGYFQLKANPGAWSLRLREGKSADIYDITHVEGVNTLYKPTDTKVIISSLRSHVIKLRVTKKPDMQNADLLADNDADGQSGIWNSITTTFGGGGTAAAADEDTETINIFSLASGHLYERLLRIMMLSVLKRTKSPVKFWFLKNYLSPQFTDYLPHMAEEYNFKYELVQYKWPRWLNQQTEKQRTIWGYKILFLDVLFPLNVRKIIFVDADAVVRADIKELYDMDLDGAPYAYTPFCDSRREMEGFRFWKQGYWRNHLMGRRYHISALYVVDLKRFRRIAAGDRLRGQYQALSQDPNSLSNLDQDLPNNMIHQVAIKSLPDEWLWCQTWCSDNSFNQAKVIDLCNNPLTKEAKLTAAQRIVPEWKSYDEEIKRLLTRIEDHENVEHETTPQEAKPPTERIEEEVHEEL